MSIVELVSLVTPPSRPIGVGSPQGWLDVEKRLGGRLPSDFKQYIDTYGQGEILDLAFVESPFAWDAGDRWFSERSRILEYFRGALDAYGFGLQAWPEKGGILPWGSDSDGNYLSWKTSDSPEDWTTVVIFDRFGGYTSIPLSMTGFLCGVITGRVEVEWCCNFDPNKPDFVADWRFR
jgi:hypothetical protein